MNDHQREYIREYYRRRRQEPEFKRRAAVSRRKARLKKSYGLTIAQYNQMRESQNFRCALCDRHEEDAAHGKLAIDHNHETGKVRGLLCSGCNSALGFLEKPDWMQRATKYLA